MVVNDCDFDSDECSDYGESRRDMVGFRVSRIYSALNTEFLKRGNPRYEKRCVFVSLCACVHMCL